VTRNALQLEAPHVATLELEAPAVAPTCEECGATSAPDGACLDIGACSRADQLATRGAASSRAKYRVPAAWNARGSVD
jgi:hypothetical protein